MGSEKKKGVADKDVLSAVYCSKEKRKNFYLDLILLVLLLLFLLLMMMRVRCDVIDVYV